MIPKSLEKTHCETCYCFHKQRKEEIIKRWREGASIRTIALEFDVSRTTVTSVVKGILGGKKLQMQKRMEERAKANRDDSMEGWDD